MFRFNKIRTALLTTLAALPLIASAQSERLSFVACPILQDTDTVPCWLAEHDGELYFLGIQTDASGWSPPWQGHKVLVEGTVTANPRVCGGIPLTSTGTPYDRRSSGHSAGVEMPNPPVTSVMRELDNTCRTILPEQPKFNTIEARRGPGPNIPPVARTPEEIARAAAARAAQPVPEPPYEAKQYEMLYEFDSELAVFTIAQAQEALRYAAAIKASTIRIVGHRSSALLSNGEYLEEVPFIAERRARELETSMRMLGIPDGVTLDVSWDTAVLQGNGQDDWSRRKAIIEVLP